MNYEYKRISDFRALYEYYCAVKSAVPYWFDADYELWLESFNEDTDYEAEKMFDELVTYAAFSGADIVGFIQFGRSRYIYNERGEKDRCGSGIIRSLFFDKEHSCGEGLVSLAEDYFRSRGISRKYAFFHALGMTCNAGHGKLFCGLPHIEEALLKYGYVREHENVYYKRMLTPNDSGFSGSVSIQYGERTPKGIREFSIICGGKTVGAGALAYLPQVGICYLRWIYIHDNEQRKGYATAALKALFSDLYSGGTLRLDTDTADGNTAAQRLYEKVGFTDMGRTRSYLK
ncbi:MAG: GNAT family N-acetyltransferase [Oscillospiraceae bacterium]